MKRLLLAALVVGLLLVPSTALTAGKRVKATGNDTWNPVTKTISKGQRVVWKNPTNDLHTVTSYGNNWNKDANLAPEGSTSKRFGQKGTYKYVCTEHGHVANNGACHGMCGKIKVN
jgi:plastocyanin